VQKCFHPPQHLASANSIEPFHPDNDRRSATNQYSKPRANDPERNRISGRSFIDHRVSFLPRVAEALCKPCELGRCTENGNGETLRDPVTLDNSITRCFRLWIGLLFIAIPTLGFVYAEPQRVVILNPFGRDMEPCSAAVSNFRSTLVKELGGPVDFHEIPLDLTHFTEPEGEAPLVDFLTDRIKRHPVDLVVPIGSAGVRFADQHRQRLFPDTRILAVAAEFAAGPWVANHVS
jgi:hypothetical protein